MGHSVYSVHCGLIIFLCSLEWIYCREGLDRHDLKMG